MALQISPGVPPTARQSKCTILSNTRALSERPYKDIIHASHNRTSVPHAFGPRKRPGRLFAFKMCSQRHIKQRAQPSGAPPTARLSKCTISSVTRAWSGMTTLKPQQRSTHVLEHAQTHHGIPLHSKGASSKHAAPQNSWRATNLSSIKMHHIERHTAVSGASTHTRTETLRSMLKAFDILLPRPNTFLDPFALKKCSQHTVPPRARASLG